MLYKIIHFFMGYCLVMITGNHQQRFLNLCVNKKILLWNVVKKKDATFFYISRKGSHFLTEISEKTKCEFSYIRKIGIPYLFYRYRKRKIAFIFFIICGIALCCMSKRLWQIEITGDKKQVQKEILSYLRKQKISYGISLSKISCETMEEDLREKYEEIAWVSCELKGTMLRISFSEVINPKQKEKTEEAPGHLIATKEGVIDSIITRNGVPKVKKGSHIKKGQILISGTVVLTDDFGEKIEKTYVCASGDVYARREISYHDIISYFHYKKAYTEKENHYYQVEVHLPIKEGRMEFFRGKQQLKQYDRKIQRSPMKIGKNFYLPITFYKITEKEYGAKQENYTKKEAKKIMKQRLSSFLAEYEAKGVEILKNNVRIDCDKKECVARGTIVIREKIGKKKKIGGKGQRGVQR